MLILKSYASSAKGGSRTSTTNSTSVVTRGRAAGSPGRSTARGTANFNERAEIRTLSGMLREDANRMGISVSTGDLTAASWLSAYSAQVSKAMYSGSDSALTKIYQRISNKSGISTATLDRVASSYGGILIPDL